MFMFGPLAPSIDGNGIRNLIFIILLNFVVPSHENNELSERHPTVGARDPADKLDNLVDRVLKVLPLQGPNLDYTTRAKARHHRLFPQKTRGSTALLGKLRPTVGNVWDRSQRPFRPLAISINHVEPRSPKGGKGSTIRTSIVTTSRPGQVPGPVESADRLLRYLTGLWSHSAPSVGNESLQSLGASLMQLLQREIAHEQLNARLKERGCALNRLLQKDPSVAIPLLQATEDQLRELLDFEEAQYAAHHEEQVKQHLVRTRHQFALRGIVSASGPEAIASLIKMQAAASMNQSTTGNAPVNLSVLTLERRGDSWDEVTSDEEALQRYAAAALQVSGKAWCRAAYNWCREQCQLFFVGNGAARRMAKDELRQHFERTGMSMTPAERAALVERYGQQLWRQRAKRGGSNRVQLLDIGSCGSHFAAFDEFDTLALDLYPARPGVFQCDFLELQVGPEGSVAVIQEAPVDEPSHDPCANGSEVPASSPPTRSAANSAGSSEVDAGVGSIARSSAKLLQLPAMKFDVAVISLVLSYLPEPLQRARMVAKARKFLASPGLLLIIEPQGVGLQAPRLFQEWRTAIEAMGFELLTYCRLGTSKTTKPHAMAFVTSDLPQVEADLRPLPMRIEVAGASQTLIDRT